MRTRLAPTLLVVAAIAVASRVRADEKQVCVKAYVDGQTSRQDGKLRAAREQLRVCARATCPATLTGDCGKWLGEVEESLPTVVIAVRDAGMEVADVRVFVDGEILTERVGGAALAIDPGEHVLRFERGGLTVEQHVSIRQGEKNRRIDATLTPVPTPVAVPIPIPIPTPPPRRGERARPVPLATLVAGGAGILSLGGFAALAATTLAARNDLDEANCKPSCDPKRVRSIQNGFLAADVLAGAGVVSIAIATALYFTRPSVLRALPAASVGVVPGGAFASMRASF